MNFFKRFSRTLGHSIGGFAADQLGKAAGRLLVQGAERAAMALIL